MPRVGLRAAIFPASRNVQCRACAVTKPMKIEEVPEKSGIGLYRSKMGPISPGEGLEPFSGGS